MLSENLSPCRVKATAAQIWEGYWDEGGINHDGQQGHL